MRRMANVSETISEPFCPLYKDVVEEKPWINHSNAHRGLLFDKFASAWRKKGDALEFDKGVGHKKGGAGQWLGKMAAKCGDSNRLTESCTRQQQLVEAMGGKTLLLKNTSRFVTGLGREHPLENGFTWHHSLGVPYLPGSSVKGILRAWYRENGPWDEANNRWEEDGAVKTLFGSHEQDDEGNEYGVGRFVCLDMLPTAPPDLDVDIITPHYGPYYQDGKTPGDWHSPVPISFLTVEVGAGWQLAILPGPARRTVPQEDLAKVAEMLSDALVWLGAGAKTAVGHGRFERDNEAEKRLRQQEESRQRELAKQRKLEQKLSGLPADVAELVKLAETEAWAIDKSNNSSFLEGVDHYLSATPEPTDACIDWIRDNCIEFFWKGIWANPDATKGKQKKPKYTSKRARELTHRLQKLRQSRQG